MLPVRPVYDKTPSIQATRLHASCLWSSLPLSQYPARSRRRWSCWLSRLRRRRLPSRSARYPFLEGAHDCSLSRRWWSQGGGVEDGSASSSNDDEIGQGTAKEGVR